MHLSKEMEELKCTYTENTGTKMSRLSLLMFRKLRSAKYP
jgi:hypothetical protein